MATMIITPQEVVDIAISGTNFTVEKISDVIIFACQEEWIRPALTDDLTDRIYDEINGTISAEVQTLIDEHLKNSLAFFVKMKITPDINAPLQNAGNSLPDFNAHSRNSSSGVKEAMKVAKDIAETYLKTAIKYIKDNEDDFPEYENFKSVSSKVRNFGGIIIPKKR